MNTFTGAIVLVLQLFQFVVLARVLLSWFPNVDRSNPLIKLVFDVTEPVLAPIRNLLPQTGMMDLSPLIVIIVISVISNILR